MFYYDYRVELQEAMIAQNWCDKITHLLTLPDHESRETTLHLMKTLANPCRNFFIHSKNRLADLETEYLKLAQEDEDEDDYFKNIAYLIKDLNRLLNKSRTHDSGEL